MDVEHTATAAKSKPYAKSHFDLYAEHVLCGRSFRSLARETGLSPSTILRRVRKVEDQRDDPLIDDFFGNLRPISPAPSICEQDYNIMPALLKEALPTDFEPTKEEQKLMRRPGETGAYLVLSQGMDKGAIFRSEKNAEPRRIAIVDRDVAKSLALRDWIKITKKATVSIYHATEAGRAGMRRAVVDDDASVFADQHREWGDKEFVDADGRGRQKVRVNLRESPLSTLARKKDKDGQPFLSKALLEAGDRLREDFELAQLGPRVAQNWDRFINGGDRGSFSEQGECGSTAAQKRLQDALSALGNGLGDIALRCCCFLEGLESAEKRMGWSARSGKIVLRISLQRLRLHYEEQNAKHGDLIG